MLNHRQRQPENCFWRFFCLQTYELALSNWRFQAAAIFIDCYRKGSLKAELVWLKSIRLFSGCRNLY
jgi:hypothetical protein